MERHTTNRLVEKTTKQQIVRLTPGHRLRTASRVNHWVGVCVRVGVGGEGGVKALLQLTNFTLGPDATLCAETHKNSVRIKDPTSVNASTAVEHTSLLISTILNDMWSIIFYVLIMSYMLIL